MKIQFSVLLIVLLFAGFIAIKEVNATVYYISSTGNDLNTGNSPASPWQTITKVNSVMPAALPGDQFLFNKGDTFYGTLNLSKSGALGNEILIGSYGSGDLPVITGKKFITGWTLYSGNIYRAPVTDSIYHLYIGNKLMTIARYPNTGFLKVDAINGNTGIYDAELNQSSGYWNGANIRLRTKNWSYESKVVTGFSGGNITFNSGTLYTTSANFGYFLDNKLDLLDTQSEWYRDYAGGYLYLYSPGGVNPNSLSVEGVVLKDGIYVFGKHYLKIQNLSIKGFFDGGVNSNTSYYCSVTDCNITQTANNAIKITGTNAKINNNYLEDNLNTAIYGQFTGGEIKNNYINRTGLYPGYGTNGRGYLGLNVHVAINLIIENNIIDSTGYSAMSVGKNVLIKNNYISYSLLKLNDGAGIDISDADTMKIQDNIILHTIGNTESSANPELYGSGIYINAGIVKNSVIENNTSAFNTYAGIYLDHKGSPINNRVIGNTLYNNFSIQILFADYSASVNIPVYNTIIKRNIFYSLSASQKCMVQRTYTGTGYNDFGTFDSNYYCSPYSEYSISKYKFPVYAENIYSLANWQTNSGEDYNSKNSLFSFSQYGITDTLSGNLVTNGTFDNNIDPWVSWPSGMSNMWATNPNLDAGCKKIMWNGTGYSQGFSISNTYPIITGETYLVSLHSAGLRNGTFNLWGLSSFSPSTFTFPQKFFSYDTVRNMYSFTYKAEITDPAAKFSIGLILPDTAVFVDNITQYRVNVDKIDSTMLSKLFYNETVSAKNISLNGISYKDIDGNPVIGSLTLQPFSSKILINENYVPSRQLNLKVLIQGLYNTIQNKMISDSIRVNIRNATSPYNIIDSKIVLVDSTGSGSYDLYNAYNSINYYLEVNNRNSLETWSSTVVSFNNNILNYDFTTSAGKAFGNNQIQMGSKFCLFSGDVNNDRMIELSDVLQVFNAGSNFAVGYVTEDVTGDYLVDLSDVQITYNNAINFISTIKP